MKRIVILDGKTLGDIKLEKLSEIGEVKYYDTTDISEVKDRVRDANIVLTNKVVLNRENLSEANNLEFIAEVATGFNNIDVEYAKEKGIGVANVAGYSTNAVVQHTFAVALALLDEVTYYDSYVKSGDYSKSGLFTCLDKPYYEIEGKTWGIIGLGNIGKKVAKIAEAFGAKVVYYSTTGNNSNDEFSRVSFDELLSKSDIISIHAPLSFLVSLMWHIARAIDENKIRGAALDVFEVEPININSPLLTMKNKDKIILSPHIAWASVEARERLFNEVIENIIAFYNGEIRNRVDK